MSLRHWSVRPGVEELNARLTPAVVAGTLPAPADPVPAVEQVEENTEITVTVLDIQGSPTFTEGELPAEDVYLPKEEQLETGNELPTIYYMMGNADASSSGLHDTGIEPRHDVPLDEMLYTMSGPSNAAMHDRQTEHTDVMLANALLKTPATPSYMSISSKPLLLPATQSISNDLHLTESKTGEADASIALELTHQKVDAPSPLLPPLSSLLETHLLKRL